MRKIFGIAVIVMAFNSYAYKADDLLQVELPPDQQFARWDNVYELVLVASELPDTASEQCSDDGELFECPKRSDIVFWEGPADCRSIINADGKNYTMWYSKCKYQGRGLYFKPWRHHKGMQ